MICVGRGEIPTCDRGAHEDNDAPHCHRLTVHQPPASVLPLGASGERGTHANCPGRRGSCAGDSRADIYQDGPKGGSLRNPGSTYTHADDYADAYIECC